MNEFVFATAQYESGDWDSAPLLPVNLIDSIARYTEISVSPTAAIVPFANKVRDGCSERGSDTA